MTFSSSFAEQQGRGIYVAPWVNDDGHAIVVAVASTGKRVRSVYVQPPRTVEDAIAHLWGVLDAADPVSSTHRPMLELVRDAAGRPAPAPVLILPRPCTPRPSAPPAAGAPAVDYSALARPLRFFSRLMGWVDVWDMAPGRTAPRVVTCGDRRADRRLFVLPTGERREYRFRPQEWRSKQFADLVAQMECASGEPPYGSSADERAVKADG